MCQLTDALATKCVFKGVVGRLIGGRPCPRREGGMNGTGDAGAVAGPAGQVIDGKAKVKVDGWMYP